MSLNRLAINNKFDLYPGLSLKNFRSHLGARYLFFEGFRVDTEATFPIAKYSNDSSILAFIFTINLLSILAQYLLYRLSITKSIQKASQIKMLCLRNQLTQFIIDQMTFPTSIKEIIC